MRLFSLISLLAALMLAGCATNPVSKSSEFVLMSESEELALGQQMAAEVARRLTLLPAGDPLTRYVDRVGQKIAAKADRPELFYRFHVVDDGTINAFALPGGYVYIHRGLLTHINSEAELAAVLGHEIGHITARHAVKRYTQLQTYNIGMTAAAILVGVPQGVGILSDTLATAMIMGYGRDQELQSDELSLKYLANAGYDARATIHLLKTLERLDAIDRKEQEDASGKKVEAYHGAFSSHPETKKRIEDAIAKAAQMQQGQQVYVGRKEYLKEIDGYPIKDGPKDGAVVGRRFLHPELGFQLEFPKDWLIQNGKGALTARLRQQKAYFLIQVKQLQKRESAETILKKMFPERRMGPITSGQQEKFSYARSLIKVSAPHISQADIDATLFLNGPRGFLVALYCERGKIETYQPQFDQIRKSFRSYNTEIDGDIPRIHTHAWKRGDSWNKLAADSRNILGPFTAERLAILNGMDSSAAPAPGTTIKIVR